MPDAQSEVERLRRELADVSRDLEQLRVAHTDALPGNMAFVSQSGALVTAVLDWATSRRIGFSHLISIGERADVDFGDMLDYLASDPKTRAILLYIESIESPRKFMSAARSAARNKPVIVIKAGRSPQGQLAAASHTAWKLTRLLAWISNGLKAPEAPRLPVSLIRKRARYSSTSST